MPTATVFIKCRRLFTSSIKREIRYLHVVVVQWRQKNVQKSVTQVQTVDVLFIQPICSFNLRNNFAREFFLHFFAVTARLRRQNA